MNTAKNIIVSGETERARQLSFQSKVLAVAALHRVEFHRNKAYGYITGIAKPTIFKMA